MGLSVRRLAEDILADYGDLSTRLAVYEQRWSGAELTQDWAHFCCDTIALLHHAAARAAQEEKHLFPAAAADYAGHRNGA